MVGHSPSLSLALRMLRKKIATEARPVGADPLRSLKRALPLVEKDENKHRLDQSALRSQGDVRWRDVCGDKASKPHFLIVRAFW